MQHQPTNSTPQLTRGCRWALFAILATGLVLRFWGLSHDLHEGVDYHPDTSKQIRAEQRFLDGRYYAHNGILDYDAYPYFNAHLVEYACRAGMAVAAGAQALAGVPVVDHYPDFLTLFWFTRILNVLFASGLILLLFQVGRENFGIGAGLVAALLLAVSPVDMASCHFATADSTASFFAMLTVLFAFRIHRHGRYRDYLWAAMAAACAFATKYHAGMAVLAVGVAHILRAGSLRALIQPAALRRAGFLAAIGFGTLFLAIPTLWSHFSQNVLDIVNFFAQVSSFRGVPDEIRNGGRVTRLLFSMRRNLPVLWDVLGPLVVAAVLLLLAQLRKREPRHLILCALPLAYFLIGVSLRPLAHPVYHTLMTSSLFLMAAVVFTWPLAVPPRFQRRLTTARVVVVTLASGYLLLYSAREAFFFWHQDTSRNALAWSQENVPRAMAVECGGYTFTTAGFAVNRTAGTVWARSNLSPFLPESACLPWKRFTLEDRSLTVFNNTSVELLMGASSWIRADAAMPTFQRFPSENGNQFIFDNGPEFIRSEKQAIVAQELPLTRWLVADAPLTVAWVAVQNGGMPNFVSWSFGGVRKAWAMTPNEFRYLPIPRPRGQFPSNRARSFYRWTARADYGRARVMLATRAEEIGRYLSNAGLSAEAVPLLKRGALETQNPTLAAMAVLDAQGAGGAVVGPLEPEVAALAARVLEAKRLDAAGLFRLYGISCEYLDALGGLDFDAGDMDATGCERIADQRAAGGRALQIAGEAISNGCVRLGPLMLDPGAYSVTVSLRAIEKLERPFGLRLQLLNRWGVVRSEQFANVEKIPNDRFSEIRLVYSVPRDMPETWLALRATTNAALILDRLRVAPAPLSTVAEIARALERGKNRAVDGGVSNATAGTVAAFGAADVTFKAGLRLVSARVSESPVRRGGAFGLDLVWSFWAPDAPVGDLTVFVHMLNSAGAPVFYGDYPLATSLREGAVANPAHPPTHAVPVAADVKPGVYRILVGLCDPATGIKSRIVSTSLECARNGAILPQTITVLE